MAKQPIASFEPLNTEYLRDFEFRDCNKAKWLSKLNFQCPMRESPLQHNITMTRDPPYVDGLGKIATKHYRARETLKEISNATFNPVSITSGTFEAFVGSN